MRLRTVFLFSWAVLLLLMQPGFFLNDEFDQAASLHSKSQGDVGVSGDLPAVYHQLARGAVGRSLNVLPFPGDEVTDSGSPMVSIVALPAYGFLRLVSLGVGPSGAVGLVAATMAGSATAALARLRGAPMAPWGLLAGAVVWATSIGAWEHSSPYLEVAAMQLTTTFLAAFSAALMFDLLRPRVGPRGALLAAFAYLFATPALFWALSIKYHGLIMALVVMGVWTYQAGHRSTPLRTGLAFAVAGVAMWAHLPNGLLLFGSMAIMALPAVLLGWRALAARAGAGVLGLGIGFLPDLLERRALEGIGRVDRHFGVPGSQVTDADTVTDTVRRADEAGYLRYAIWNDTSGALEAAWSAFFWIEDAPDVAANAMPVVALTPFLVAAALAWRFRRGLGPVLLAWPLVHVVVLFSLFGAGVYQNGAGYDLRQAATIWPFLVILAAPGLAWAWSRLRRPGSIGASAPPGVDAPGAGAAAGGAPPGVVAGGQRATRGQTGRRGGLPELAAGGAWLLLAGVVPFLLLRQTHPGVRLPDFDMYDFRFQLMGPGYLLALASAVAMAFRRRWPDVLASLLIAGVGMSMLWQVMLPMAAPRATGFGVEPPYAFAPMALLDRGVEWLLLSWG